MLGGSSPPKNNPKLEVGTLMGQDSRYVSYSLLSIKKTNQQLSLVASTSSARASSTPTTNTQQHKTASVCLKPVPALESDWARSELELGAFPRGRGWYPQTFAMMASSQLLEDRHVDESSRQSGHEDSSSDSDSWRCPSCHDEVDSTQQLACGCGYRVSLSALKGHQWIGESLFHGTNRLGFLVSRAPHGIMKEHSSSTYQQRLVRVPCVCQPPLNAAWYRHHGWLSLVLSLLGTLPTPTMTNRCVRCAGR